MFRLKLTIVFSFMYLLLLNAQFYDNTWVLGYGGGVEDNNGFGLTILDFSKNQLSIGEELEVDYWMEFNNTSICNKEGELQFYFNGRQVFNSYHELVENGDSMYLGEISAGYDAVQGAIILPFPEQAPKYVIFQTEVDYNEEISAYAGYRLYYSVIDIDANSGEGLVVLKNELLAEGVHELGKLTAAKHANGRDWWIIWRLKNSNTILRFLLSPTGIERLENQTIGENIISGLGQALFSPNGSKHILFNTINADEGIYVNIYDFDRCTGLMSNQLEMHFSHDGGAGGAVISPNSRFLYIPSRIYIYQFDLWAEDIEASKDTVAVYDGFLDPFGSTTFFMGQLARDGKIYISSPSTVKSLTVIENPDEQGLASNVRQHAIRLPVRNAFGIPTFPNHRLGPLDGSPCDTLGIDNIPLSNFRTDQDTSDYLSFYFQDLSAYQPAEWEWSFGDGVFSQDTSPVHIYQEDGVYEVCLTVSNENGSHSSCDTLNLGTVNTSEEVVLDIQPQVFPNPFQGQFSFVLNDYFPRYAELLIFDGLGRRLQRQRIFQGWNTVSGDDWASGIYFWELWDGVKKRSSGRVVRM